MVQLNYQFIFNPGANAWASLGEFENDLSDFLAANGLEAEVMVPVSGNGATGVMMVSKIQEPEVLQNKKGPQLSTNPATGKPMKSSQIVSGLTRQLSYKPTQGNKLA